MAITEIVHLRNRNPLGSRETANSPGRYQAEIPLRHSQNQRHFGFNRAMQSRSTSSPSSREPIWQRNGGFSPSPSPNATTPVDVGGHPYIFPTSPSRRPPTREEYRNLTTGAYARPQDPPGSPPWQGNVRGGVFPRHATMEAGQTSPSAFIAPLNPQARATPQRSSPHTGATRRGIYRPPVVAADDEELDGEN